MPATMLSGQILGQYDEQYAKRRLVAAGLKPTRQRVALCTMLFEGPPRHVTVEELHRQAADAGHRLSLATVYNTLKQFGEAGLVRRISVPGGRGYFDVDTGDHHHFYIADEDRIIDIPVGSIALGDLPEPPEGYRIDKVDIVVHLKRVDGDRD
jgi:Fur family transcriptional regulator, iron response regulator